MRKYWLWSGLLFILVLSACSQVATPAAEVEAAAPTATPNEAGDPPPPTDTRAPEASPTTAPQAEPEGETAMPDEPPPAFAAREFSTDFSIHSVPYSEILSGGPPKDGIPAIDDPQFISLEEANAWLKPQEPVILFQLGDDARAYPIQILMWHEIVNDVVEGVPVVVTFCPLCNTAIAFERTLDGQVLDFGTTGRLRFSNLIMYDRQTETWWQQATGDAIAGVNTGRRLTFLPASIIGWQEFKDAYPDGLVLSRDTGFNRSYGNNPYAGYDDINRPPFLYVGPQTPGKLPPMARVLTVDLNGEAVAYPYDLLREAQVVNDVIGEQPIVVFWSPGTASAFGQTLSSLGDEVGTANAFYARLEGEVLTFTSDGQRIVDEQTNSTWNVLGQAIEGPLAGRELEPVVAINHFWFSWAAFRPETRTYTP